MYSLNFIDYDKYLVSGFIDGYMLVVDTKDINNHKKYFIPNNALVNDEDSNIKYSSGLSVKFIIIIQIFLILC